MAPPRFLDTNILLRYFTRSDPEKAARADYVYENSGSLEELDRFVASVLADLT